MNSVCKHFLLATLASAGLFALPTLKITDTVTSSSVTVTDGGVGDADGLVNGNISYSSASAFSGWNIIFSAGTTKPTLGSAALPVLNLNGTIIRNPRTAGTMLFSFMESGFTGYPYQGTLTGGVSSIGAAGSALVSSTLNSAAYNSLAPLAYTKNSSAAANNTGAPATPIGPYSLGLSYKVTVNAGINAQDLNRQANFTASLSSVPEPGFYGALAIGLSGIFFVVNRRRRSDVTA